MQKLKSFLKNIWKILRAQKVIGGLEISDHFLRFAIFKKDIWQTTGLQLPPGIIEKGELKNPEQFREALGILKNQIKHLTKTRASKIHAVVSLSSADIYSQVFTLPFVEGDNLEQAVELNLRMASPAEASETYSSWQLLNEGTDTLRLEILGAFVNKKIIDAINSFLHRSGFFPVAIEPRALSLVRLIRELDINFDPIKPQFILSLDALGLKLLIMRRGQLYFEYFKSWLELQGEEREINLKTFETIISRSLQQVLNFYNLHWQEPISKIIILTPGLQTELIKIIKDNFNLESKGAVLGIGGKAGGTQELNLAWAVAAGAGLRGLGPRSRDHEISLLGINAGEEFRQEQTLDFLIFWRTLLPVALGLLLAVFLGTKLFLSYLPKSLEKKAVQITPQQLNEINEFRIKTKNFNWLVGIMRDLQNTIITESPILEKIFILSQAREITINKFSYQANSKTASLIGLTKTEDQIIKFKADIETDPRFGLIQLPLSEIKKGPEGFSFVLNFSVK